MKLCVSFSLALLLSSAWTAPLERASMDGLVESRRLPLHTGTNTALFNATNTKRRLPLQVGHEYDKVRNATIPSGKRDLSRDSHVRRAATWNGQLSRRRAAEYPGHKFFQKDAAAGEASHPCLERWQHGQMFDAEAYWRGPKGVSYNDKDQKHAADKQDHTKHEDFGACNKDKKPSGEGPSHKDNNSPKSHDSNIHQEHVVYQEDINSENHGEEAPHPNEKHNEGYPPKKQNSPSPQGEHVCYQEKFHSQDHGKKHPQPAKPKEDKQPDHHGDQSSQVYVIYQEDLGFSGPGADKKPSAPQIDPKKDPKPVGDKKYPPEDHVICQESLHSKGCRKCQVQNASPGEGHQGKQVGQKPKPKEPAEKDRAKDHGSSGCDEKQNPKYIPQLPKDFWTFEPNPDEKW